MNPPEVKPPAQPARRPAHHLGVALNHHRAHRKRVQAQAAAHFTPPSPPRA